MRWCGRLRHRSHPLCYDQDFTTKEKLSIPRSRTPALAVGLGAVSHSLSCDIMERTRASGSRPMHLPRDNAAQGASWVLVTRSLVCASVAAGCCIARGCCVAAADCCL